MIQKQNAFDLNAIFELNRIFVYELFDNALSQKPQKWLQRDRKCICFSAWICLTGKNTVFWCRSLTSHATICKRHSHTLLETKHEKKGITITQLINNKILPHCTVERIPKSKWQYTRPTHEFHHFNLAFTFAIVKDSKIRSKELW